MDGQVLSSASLKGRANPPGPSSRTNTTRSLTPCVGQATAPGQVELVPQERDDHVTKKLFQITTRKQQSSSQSSHPLRLRAFPGLGEAGSLRCEHGL